MQKTILRGLGLAVLVGCLGWVPLHTAVAQSSSEDGASLKPSISADGRYIAFQSEDAHLEPGDTNAASDIFVLDTQTNTLSLSGDFQWWN